MQGLHGSFEEEQSIEFGLHMLASVIWGYGLGLVNLSLPCYAIVMSGMSGYLDGLNFDSDEDFEETAAGRAGARPADSQHEAAGDGGCGTTSNDSCVPYKILLHCK